MRDVQRTANRHCAFHTIQFRGENAANFGDYSDGFTHAMGDTSEGRIAATLAFRASNNQTCPVASGSSAPRLAKSSLDLTGMKLAVSKPATRSNRIVRY